jgi:hypothetical protein
MFAVRSVYGNIKQFFNVRCHLTCLDVLRKLLFRTRESKQRYHPALESDYSLITIDQTDNVRITEHLPGLQLNLKNMNDKKGFRHNRSTLWEIY